MLRIVDIEEVVLLSVLIIYYVFYDMDLLLDRLDIGGRRKGLPFEEALNDQDVKRRGELTDDIYEQE
ncbi:hypothetical protein [Paenibacillus dendritiformis]|uniref:hypothetical protein n=1 Tax=Paenibacillus dendritiformis TaxID=130049 RepID=UPI0030B89BC9